MKKIKNKSTIINFNDTKYKYINDTIFGHIHNDAHLGGTRTLEGSSFSYTVAYIKHYVEACLAGNTTLSKNKISCVHPLLNKLDGMLSIVKQCATHSGSENELQKIATSILEQILNNNDSTLMPGGWLAIPSGHAMVYEFRHDSKTGDLLFVIHNTGAGLEFHLNSSDQDKDRYYPIKVYRIPKNSLTNKQQELKYFIVELLKPQLEIKHDKNAELYDAQRLYGRVFSKISYVDGELISPKKHIREDVLTASQISGTCAQRVLHQMLESQFDTKKDYKQFIYGLKKYSLQEYAEKVAFEGNINAPGVRNQVSLAIEKLSRMLLLKVDFTAEQRKQEQEFLAKLRKKFVKLSYKGYAAQDEIANYLDEFKKNDRLFSIVGTDDSDEDIFYDVETNKNNFNGIVSTIKLELSGNILDSLNRFSADCHTFIEQGHYLTVKNSIEVMLNSFPINKEHDFYRKLQEPDNLDIFYNYIEKIGIEYQISHQHSQEANLISPNFIVTNLSYIAITMNAANNDQRINGLDVIQDSVISLLYLTKNNPFLATDNFTISNRLLEIRNNLSIIENDGSKISKNKRINDTLCKAYLKILEDKTDLTEALKSCYKNIIPISPDYSAFKLYFDKRSEYKALLTLTTIANKQDFKDDFLAKNKYLQEELESALNKLKTQEKIESILFTPWSCINEEDSAYSREGYDIAFCNLHSQSVDCKPTVDNRPKFYHNQLPLIIKHDDKFYILGYDSKRNIQQTEVNEKYNYLYQNLKYMKEKERYHSSTVQKVIENILLTKAHTPLCSKISFKIISDNEPGQTKILSLTDQTYSNSLLNTKLKKYGGEIENAMVLAPLNSDFSAIEKPSTNSIQMDQDDRNNRNRSKESYERQFYADDLLKRELFHLRTSPHSQVVATIDFFNNHIKYLKNPDFQNYFEKNIFEPGILKKTLMEHPKTFDNLNLLINKGITYFTKNNIASATTAFFATLSAKVNMYAKDFSLAQDSNVNYKEKAQENLIKTKETLDRLLKFELDATVKSELHKSKIFVLFNFYQPSFNNFPLEEYLFSWLFICSNPEHNKTANFAERISLENTSHKVMALLQNMENAKIISAIQKVLPKLDKNYANLTGKWEYSYPIIKCVDELNTLVSVDVSKGNIFTKGLTLSPLPIKVYTSKSFKKVFGSNIKTAFKFEDGTGFQLTHDGKEYKISIDDYDGHLKIQSKFSIDNIELEWYQLYEFSEQDRYDGELINSYDFDGIKLPCISEPSNLLWVKLSAAAIITDANSNKVKYYHSQESAHLIKTTNDGRINISDNFIVNPKESDLHNFLSRFEDPKFIEIVYNKEDNKGTISFPRYNIELLFSQTYDSLWDITLKGTDYKLQLDNLPNAISGTNNALQFVRNKNDNQEKIILLPIQQFIVNRTIKDKNEYTSEYNDFKLDVSNQIAQFTLKNYYEEIGIKKEDDEEFDLQYSNVEQYSKFLLEEDDRFKFKMPKTEDIGNYTNGIHKTKSKIKISDLRILDRLHVGDIVKFSSGDEQSIEAIQDNIVILSGKKIVHDVTTEIAVIHKTVKAFRTVDNLYLTYVHLCNNNSLESTKILQEYNKFNGGLIGTEEEIEFLRMIVECVPGIINKKTDEKAIIKTPEVLTVQLQALSLLSRFKQNGNVISFPSNVLPDNPTDNEVISHIRKGENVYFYNNITSIIKETYTKYYKIRKKVTIEYVLDAQTKLSLLRQFKPKTGAIQVEWQKLETEQKIKELKQLKQLPDTSKDLLQSRITQIEETLQKNKPVYFFQKNIVSTNIPAAAKSKGGNLNFKTDKLQDGTSNQDYQKSRRETLKDLITLSCEKPSINQIETSVKIGTNPFVSEIEFIKNFSTMYYFVQNKYSYSCDAKYILLGKIQDFCKATILAYRDEPIEKSVSNIPELCRILYYVLDHNNEVLQLKLLNNESSAEDAFKKLVTLAANSDTVISVKELTSKNLSEIKIAERQDFFPKEANRDPKQIFTIQYRPTMAQINHKEEFTIIKLLGKCEQNKELTTFYNEYLKLDEKITSEIQKTIVNSATHSIADYHVRMNKKTEEDESVGEKINSNTSSKISLAKKVLGSEEVRNNILAETCKMVKEINSGTDKLLKEIIELANSSMRETDWLLRNYGKKHSKLNLKMILKLYLSNDRNEYANATGLKVSDIRSLHRKITEYLVLQIKKQQLDRVSNEIIASKGITNTNGINFDNAIQKISSQLMAQNKVDFNNEPELMLFQFFENLLIRTQQKEYIASLLLQKDGVNFSDKLIQMIMGGGKSKVLLPILALKKANGVNLSIIEVPAALYETNYSDLNRTSQRLFDQPAIKFLFNRDSKCSAYDLKLMYKKFLVVIIYKKYIVTTGESSQSLELKYLELLLECPEASSTYKINEWKKQIKWLDRIVKLFRNRGNALIDEADSGLDVRKQLNYSIGDGTTVPKIQIDTVVNMFLFFAAIELRDVINLDKSYDKLRVLDCIRDSSKITNEDDWELIFKHLVVKMFENTNSPIAGYIKDLQTTNSAIDIKSDLARYLLNGGDNENKLTKIPQFIKGSTPELKNVIATLKEEINNILPLTLKRKLNEHYGDPDPENKKETNELKKSLAVPYISNNIPNPTCKFGNHLEAINYTIQRTLIEGISRKLLKTLIKQWQDDEREELIRNKDTSNTKLNEPASDVGKMFCYITKDSGVVRLDQIDLKNNKQFLLIYEKLKFNATFIGHCLKEHILKQITIDASVLHSNPQNHLSLYKSVQGMTGTPYNHRAVSLPFEEKHSIGTEGITVNHLKRKKTNVYTINYQNPTQFLGYALTKIASNDQMANHGMVRAIIDIGATFRGVTNETVANEIAQYLAKKENKSKFTTLIKWVLFFNADNKICAKSVSSLQNMLIGTSDLNIIKDKLGCGPSAVFTYYDQGHTIGTDLKQCTNAIAITTFDKTTLKKDLLQGVMRMRDLSGSHKIVIVINNEVAKVFKDPNKICISDIIEMSSVNQNNVLVDDHFRGTIQKIDNIIRDYALLKILSVSNNDLSSKHKLAKMLSLFFIRESSDDAFLNYGCLETEIDTKEIFLKKKQTIISNLSIALQNSGEKITKNEVDDLESKISKVITDGIRNCSKLNFFREQDSIGSEVEAQKEVSVEVEVKAELKLENITYNPSDKCHKFIPMNYYSNIGSIGEIIKTNDKYKLLNNIVNCEDLTWEFSENIKCSDNWYQTTEDQKNYLDLYQKPVHAMLFLQDENNINCLIVTLEEVEDLIKRGLPSNSTVQDKYIWITSISGQVLAGKNPDIKNISQDYPAIIEQIKFFAGDLASLAEQEEELKWTLDKFNDKIDFFTHKLQNFRLTSDQDIKSLQRRSSTRQEIYQYIEKYCHQDCTNAKWQEIIPNIGNNDLEVAKNLAKAFNFARENWFSTDLEKIDYNIHHAVPLLAIPYITKYVAHLSSLRNLSDLVKIKEIKKIENILENNLELLNINSLNLLIASQGDSIITLVGGIMLHLAVDKEDVKLAKYLLKKGVDLNYKFNEQNPLDKAINIDNKRMIELLYYEFIKKKIKEKDLAPSDEDLQDYIFYVKNNKNNHKLLNIATKYGSVDMVKYMIDNLELSIDEKEYALTLSKNKNKIEIITFLEEHISEIKFGAAKEEIIKACKNNEIENVKLIISKNINFKEKLINCHLDSYINISLLFVSINNVNKELVEYLLEQGANIKCKNKRNQTPLVKAKLDMTKFIEKGNCELSYIITLLLNKLTNDAIVHGDLELVKKLFEQNQDEITVDMKNNYLKLSKDNMQNNISDFIKNNRDGRLKPHKL